MACGFPLHLISNLLRIQTSWLVEAQKSYSWSDKLYHKFKDRYPSPVKHDDYSHIPKSITANHDNPIDLRSLRLHLMLFWYSWRFHLITLENKGINLKSPVMQKNQCFVFMCRVIKCNYTPERQSNSSTYHIVTFLAGFRRTEGSNLLHQSGTDVSARQPKQPAAIITARTHYFWNDSRLQQFASNWCFFFLFSFYNV